jgi:hypothetical protein
LGHDGQFFSSPALDRAPFWKLASDVFGPGITGTVDPIGVCTQALSTITPAKAIKAYNFIVASPLARTE